MAVTTLNIANGVIVALSVTTRAFPMNQFVDLSLKPKSILSNSAADVGYTLPWT